MDLLVRKLDLLYLTCKAKLFHMRLSMTAVWTQTKIFIKQKIVTRIRRLFFKLLYSFASYIIDLINSNFLVFFPFKFSDFINILIFTIIFCGNTACVQLIGKYLISVILEISTLTINNFNELYANKNIFHMQSSKCNSF